MKNVVLYLTIGGLLSGAMDSAFYRDCHTHFSDNEIAIGSALWPAFLTAAFMSSVWSGDHGDHQCQK